MEILWACVNFEGKDEYLGVGLKGPKALLTSHPLDHVTTLHYFFWHQQILNNLDRDIELGWSDFLEAYHFPKCKNWGPATNASSPSKKEEKVRLPGRYLR